MASVFKRGRDKGKKGACWFVSYQDHEGKRRTAKGFTDKGLTTQLGAKLENEAMLRRRKLIDPKQEKIAAHATAPIKDHLTAFETKLRTTGNNTEKHVKLTMTRVRAIIKGCGVESLADLDEESVEAFLFELRSAKGLGNRTVNHYIQAIDEFCRWLVDKKRATMNPVSGLNRLNTEVDIRHPRRALTDAEVSKLVATARASVRTIQGYAGELRARAYTLSYLTGLRRLEMASLTPASFDLDAEQPIVHVAAACSKHRKEDVLPLHPELVKQVRSWIQGMALDEPLFPRIDRKKTWLMVKLDLEAGGIPYNVMSAF